MNIVFIVRFHFIISFEKIIDISADCYEVHRRHQCGHDDQDARMDRGDIELVVGMAVAGQKTDESSWAVGEAEKVEALQMCGYWKKVEKEVVPQRSVHLQDGKVEALHYSVVVRLPWPNPLLSAD